MRTILFLIMMALPLTAIAQNAGAAATPVQTAAPQDSIVSSLNEEIARLHMEQLRRDVDFAQQHIERANLIIDWSAMFYAAMAILLIVAGAVGIREFATIRKTETQMINLRDELREELRNIRTELEEVRNHRSDLINETNRFVETTYFLNEGINAYRSGYYLKAKEFLNKVLSIDPHDVRAHLYLGTVLDSEEKHEAAAEVYYELLKFDPDNPKAYYGLGNNCSSSDPDRAIAYFEKAALLAPDEHYIYVAMGRHYRKTGQVEKAIDVLKKSRALQRHADSAFQLGIIYYTRNDDENTLKYFDETRYLAQQMIENVDLKSNWYYYDLSVVEALCGDAQKAEDYMHRSLAHNASLGVIQTMLKELNYIQSFDKKNNLKSLIKILKLEKDQRIKRTDLYV